MDQKISLNAPYRRWMLQDNSRGPWVIIASLLLMLLVVGMLADTETGPYAVVIIQDEVIRALPLSAPGTYSFQDQGVAYTVIVEDRRIALVDIDCSDQACMRAGFIEDSSRGIVCAPNQLLIKISADQDGVHMVESPKCD